MAKDKRHTILGDMNALNLTDGSALTDQERKTLKMRAPATKPRAPRKSM